MQSAEGGVDTAMRCIASCSYSDHQPWTPKTTVEGERVRVRHVARFSGLESLSEYSPHGHQASSCSLAWACGLWLPPMLCWPPPQDCLASIIHPAAWNTLPKLPQGWASPQLPDLPVQSWRALGGQAQAQHLVMWLPLCFLHSVSTVCHFMQVVT